jgi:hypothetical protein
MKIDPIELLADPVGAINRIMAMMADHALLSFADDPHITPEELAAVAELNAAACLGKREEIRLLLVSELRRHGAAVPDGFGIASAPDWKALAPLGDRPH